MTNIEIIYTFINKINDGNIPIEESYEDTQKDTKYKIKVQIYRWIAAKYSKLIADKDHNYKNIKMAESDIEDSAKKIDKLLKDAINKHEDIDLSQYLPESVDEKEINYFKLAVYEENDQGLMSDNIKKAFLSLVKR